MEGPPQLGELLAKEVSRWTFLLPLYGWSHLLEVKSTDNGYSGQTHKGIETKSKSKDETEESCFVQGMLVLPYD